MDADPDSRRAMISWIIAELVDDVNFTLGEKADTPRTKEHSCLSQLRKEMLMERRVVAQGKRDARFPWTHNRDGFDFHKYYPRKTKSMSLEYCKRCCDLWRDLVERAILEAPVATASL